MLLVGFGVGLAATYLFLNKKSEKSDFLGVKNLNKRTTRLGGGVIALSEPKPCKCGDDTGQMAIKINAAGQPYFVCHNASLNQNCGRDGWQ